MIKQHPLYKDYFITDDGRVFSNKQYKDKSRMRKLRPFMTEGYKRVGICTDKGRKHKLVHRLVLDTYVGLPKKGQLSRHLNGVRADNRIENLRWGTPEENQADMLKHNLERVAKGEECRNKKISNARKEYIKRYPDSIPKGEDSPMSKLSNEQACQVIKDYSEGMITSHLAFKYKVSRRTIQNILNGYTYGAFTNRESSRS